MVAHAGDHADGSTTDVRGVLEKDARKGGAVFETVAAVWLALNVALVLFRIWAGGLLR